MNERQVAAALILLARSVVAARPAKPKQPASPDIDPYTFLGRWFMSKKRALKLTSIAYFAKKYPYSGEAFRLDTEPPLIKPLGSWCRTTTGLFRWKQTMHPLGLKPKGYHNYKGTISVGIDLAAMAVGEGLADDFADTIVAVEEVSPLQPVQNVKEVW